jgi:hypothetical protein
MIREVNSDKWYIEVLAICTQQEQAEKVKNEMAELDLTLITEQKLGNKIRIAGIFKVPSKHDVSGQINKKIDQLLNAEWRPTA